MSSTRWSRPGCTEVVLAPGSRNAPLAFAAYDAAEAGLLRLHTRIDERTAGFLALGLARDRRAGAAVVCTSGTAVANLHPAVLEAAHAGVPLVVVTADRPARLRGTGANQTTDQVGDLRRRWSPTSTLTPARRGSTWLVAAVGRPCTSTSSSTSRWCPTDRWTPADPREPAAAAPRAGSRGHDDPLDAGPRTVVVAGDDAGPPARVLAEDGGLAAARRADAAGRAPATTRCAATGCCSTATSAERIERVWSSATRRCPGR